MSIFLFKRLLRRSLPASGANVSEVLRTDEKIFERSPTIFLARTEGNENHTMVLDELPDLFNPHAGARAEHNADSGVEQLLRAVFVREE